MQHTTVRAAALLVVAMLFSACGGGGMDATPSTPSTPTPPAMPSPPATPPPVVPAVTKAEAFRFLNQATFGATEAEAARLMALGNSATAYSLWIDAELAKPASTLLSAVEQAYPNPVPAGFNIATLNAPRIEKWFGNVLTGG